MRNPNKKQVKNGIRIISATITIASLILIIYTIINSHSLHQQFQDQVQLYGIPSIFVLCLFLDLLPQFLSPMAILIAGIVAGISTPLAIIIASLGSLIGSIIGFAIGKKYMYGAVRLTASESSTQKLTHLTNKYGKIIVPVAAISPLPYLPILLGAMNFTKKNFIIYGLLSRVASLIVVGCLTKII